MRLPLGLALAFTGVAPKLPCSQPLDISSLLSARVTPQPPSGNRGTPLNDRLRGQRNFPNTTIAFLGVPAGVDRKRFAETGRRPQRPVARSGEPRVTVADPLISRREILGVKIGSRKCRNRRSLASDIFYGYGPKREQARAWLAGRPDAGSFLASTPGTPWRRTFFTASAGVTFFTARVRIPAKGSKTLTLGSPPSPDPAPNAGFSPDEPFGASERQWTLLQPLLRTWRPLADCHSKNTLNSGSTPLPTLAHVKRGLPPLDQFACMNAGSQRKGAG